MLIFRRIAVRITLRKLARLLGADYSDCRAHVHELARALDEGRSAFQAAYCTTTWWGGAGSMADLWLKTPKDCARYQGLLIELVERAERYDVHCPAAMLRAEQFRNP